MTEAVVAAAEQVAPEIRRITAKEFLSLRPKVLKEQEVTVVINEEVEMSVTVRQLTKSQANVLNKRVINEMPEVPTIEHEYKTMHTDPITGQPRRPGKYKEPNPDDPKYKQQLEVWFNEACVWLAILSAADDFGVTPENLDKRFEEIGDELPAPALLRVALEAAKVNRGLNIADQMILQVQSNQAMMDEYSEFADIAREIIELRSQKEVSGI